MDNQFLDAVILNLKNDDKITIGFVYLNDKREFKLCTVPELNDFLLKHKESIKIIEKKLCEIFKKEIEEDLKEIDEILFINIVAYPYRDIIKVTPICNYVGKHMHEIRDKKYRTDIEDVMKSLKEMGDILTSEFNEILNKYTEGNDI